MEGKQVGPDSPAWVTVMILTLGYLIYPTYTKAVQVVPAVNGIGSAGYERLNQRSREYNEALAAGDSLNIAEQGYRLGKSYIGVGDQLAAHRLFMQALKIWEPRGHWESMSKVCMRLAEHHLRLRQQSEAFRYARLGLDFAKRGGVKHNLMGAHSCLSHVFLLQYDESKDDKIASQALKNYEYYFQRAVKLALELGNQADIANIYALYGYTFDGSQKKEFNPHKRLLYLKRANDVFAKEKIIYGLINTRNTLVKIYLNMHQPTQAKKWLMMTKYVMDTSKLADYQQKGYFLESSAILYEQLFDYRQSLEYYKRYHEHIVGALNLDREGAVSRLAVEYETEKRAALVTSQRKELSLQTQNLKTQKRVTQISIAVGLAAIICVVVFYWLYRKYRYAATQNELLVAEQNHRVKNNLQQITSLLSLQSNRMQDSIGKQVLEESLLRVHAVSLVHQRLYDGIQLAQVDLAEYIPRLAASVFTIFGMESFKPEYLVEKIWLHADKAASFGLILNEMMTNACKYALPNQQDPSLIVSCIQQGKSIVFEMKDNGPGFSYESVKKGFGLQLIAVLVGRLKAVLSTDKKGNHFTLVFEP